MSKKKKPRPMTQLAITAVEQDASPVSRETKPKKPKFFLIPQEMLGTLIVGCRFFLADASIPLADKTNMRRAEEALLEVLNTKPVSRETRKTASHGAPKKQRSPRSA